MKLIIFGPPGSGKGTYSIRLKERYGLEKISTGDIFREEIKSGTVLGKEIEHFLKEGKLVPDEVVIKVVKNKLKNLDNFILDGYPRTVEQAKALDEITKIDAIIRINAHKEILIEKISARRICSNPKCDGNYNIADIRKTVNGVDYLLPPLLPKNDLVCDKCGSPLIQREDDNLKTIEERLKIYENQSRPVLDYYKSKGAGRVPIIDIWMSRPPEITVEKIIESLNQLKIK
ncbi:MAG: nucleoside monophosphate kinase [Nitrososphaeria archaeon]